MGLQKFRKNILKATSNLEFLAVLVFPDSSITLDTRMSNLDIRMSKLDICVSRLDIRVSVPTILVLTFFTIFCRFWVPVLRSNGNESNRGVINMLGRVLTGLLGCCMLSSP